MKRFLVLLILLFSFVVVLGACSQTEAPPPIEEPTPDPEPDPAPEPEPEPEPTPDPEPGPSFDPTGFYEGYMKSDQSSITPATTVAITVSPEGGWNAAFRIGDSYFFADCAQVENTLELYCITFGASGSITWRGPVGETTWTGTWEFNLAQDDLTGTFGFTQDTAGPSPSPEPPPPAPPAPEQPPSPEPPAPEPPAPVINSVTINEGDQTLQVGTTQQLTATVDATGDADTNVAWMSDNEAVATVDQNGIVTAVAEGMTTITAISTFEGTKFDSVEITVVASPDPEPVVFDPTGFYTGDLIPSGGNVAVPTSATITEVEPGVWRVVLDSTGTLRTLTCGVPEGFESYLSCSGLNADENMTMEGSVTDTTWTGSYRIFTTDGFQEGTFDFTQQ